MAKWGAELWRVRQVLGQLRQVFEASDRTDTDLLRLEKDLTRAEADLARLIDDRLAIAIHEHNARHRRRARASA